MGHSTTPHIDEQALAERFDSDTRRRLGAYFTPVAVVDQVLDAVERHLPRSTRIAFVDPACGAGAFLVRAAERFPRAKIFGLELEEASLQIARRRLPAAVLARGDALAEGPLEKLLARVDADFEVWIGNPPYNGTSALLKNPARWRALASRVQLAAGQSLREDYLFFMLRALERLKSRRGMLAFVTSRTLLDAWAYAPVRQLLLESLALREVHELGRAFRGTQVATCFTVFDSGRGGLRAFRQNARHAELEGIPLSQIVPISLPGLKTRFEELLVDDDRDRLIDRMKRFAAGKRIDISSHKLHALPRVPFDARAVRRFLHPNGRRAWCYVDRRLIPRGDHRMQGAWDPHACDVKLVFNVRELPLHAQVIDEPGCVTAYRHTRFAPLYVPKKVREEGLSAARRGGDLGPLVPNLTIDADPRTTFEEIARQVMSDEIQRVWAPALGTMHEVPIRL
jgi:tRNA1(Val) A37 N6-methylase TrmN6